MLKRFHHGRQRHGGLRYFKRGITRFVDRVFRPVTARAIRTCLESVGVSRGMTVCVHSALSRFGFIQGGADAIIEQIEDIVGSQGRILMPSFPWGGSTYDYLQEGHVFDVRESPSSVGIITEVFRRRGGVLRSYHPTNPVAGWGRDVWGYLEEHEKSASPFGDDTPYGRLARDTDGYILMMETHVHSFLHHLQERVDFPNLFLPDRMEATFVTPDGVRHTMETRVMRPRTSYFVAIPGAEDTRPDWAILHDYALIFPRARIPALREHGYDFQHFPRLLERQSRLEARGALRTVRLGRGTVGLLHVRGFLDEIEQEFRDLIDRFRPHYVPERIDDMGLPYL